MGRVRTQPWSGSRSGEETSGPMRRSFWQERGPGRASRDPSPPARRVPAAADFPAGFLRGSPWVAVWVVVVGKEPLQGEPTLLGQPRGLGAGESPRQLSLVLCVCPGGHVAEGEELGGPGRGLEGPRSAAGPVVEAAESPGRARRNCPPPTKAADGEALGALGQACRPEHGETPQSPGKDGGHSSSTFCRQAPC